MTARGLPGGTPIIGVPADLIEIDGLLHHRAGEKYLFAAIEAAGGLPLIVPALIERLAIGDVLAALDGLLLTGAVSNVEPQRYGMVDEGYGPYDPQRDTTTLALIPAAIAAGVPLLAICRGHQELNVALGGTLSPRVHELPGRFDHRARKQLPLAEQYEPVHAVRLAEGGMLRDLAGTDEVMVNSLHWQAIDRLADRLAVEATALDGTIEAVRVKDAPRFAVGIQWHPEWRVMDNPFARALFGRFGDAARTRMAERSRRNVA